MDIFDRIDVSDKTLKNKNYLFSEQVLGMQLISTLK